MSETLIVFVDNQGSVDVFAKGHSTACVYTSTVAKACFDLSVSMGCTLVVRKTRRCSDTGSGLADMLSKGELAKFRGLLPERRPMAQLPRVLIDWVKDPVEDLSLGSKIAEELQLKYPEIVPVN